MVRYCTFSYYLSVVQKTPIKKEDLKYKYHYPPVPGNMGWNWVAEDVPGMKVRHLI